jgi:hypothetical protein
MSRNPSRQEDTERDDPTIPAAGPAGLVSAEGLQAAAGASGPLALGMTETPHPGGLSIPIASVLKYAIEGYLFGDLDSMKDETTLKEFGSVGYPMVGAVLSGSELLGALTGDVKEDNRIEHYWSGYMAQVDKRYRYLGRIAKQLIRNGVAHIYLSHTGVGVVRQAPQRHLRRERDELVWDCEQLYVDFRRSYEDHAKAYILDHLADAQRRLDKLTRYEAELARQVTNLPQELFPVVDIAPTSSDPVSGTYSLATPQHLTRSR